MCLDISLPTPPAKTPTHPIMFYFSALKIIVFYRIQISFGFIKLYILEGLPLPHQNMYKMFKDPPKRVLSQDLCKFRMCPPLLLPQ